LLNGFPFESAGFHLSEGVPIVRIRDLLAGCTETYYRGPNENEARIDSGDLLIGMDGDFNVAWWSDGPAILNQRVCCLRPDARLDKRFLYFWLPFPLKWLNDLTYSTTVKHLSSPDVLKIRFPLPPLHEQQAIAAFLDRETARINSLIWRKERLIALLEEKRQAVISYAVTRGLDLVAPLKDSGIPWLGLVPKHWRIMRIADLAGKITNGFVGPTRDILFPDGVRYLQSLHIKEGEIRFDKPYYVSQQWSNEHGKSVLKGGDVLIVQTGDIGQVAAVPREFANCNCHALIIVQMKPGYGSGFFLSAFLRSQYGRQTLLACQTGATHPHLECGKVRDIRVALPPPEEQNEIVAYLDKVTAKLRDAESRIKDGIACLQEYRMALTSAAVTGQIDVRDEVTHD
jgi:type I restriction enzyme S subunit